MSQLPGEARNEGNPEGSGQERVNCFLYSSLPSITEKIERLNQLYSQSSRKHNVKGVPFDAEAMLRDVIAGSIELHKDYLRLKLLQSQGGIPADRLASAPHDIEGFVLHLADLVPR